MSVFDIIGISIIGILFIVALIFVVKKFLLLSTEEKKERILHWLTGAVTVAQNNILGKDDESNKQKFEQVVQSFKTKAPFLYKIFIMFNKDINLEELIEKALATLKTTKF